MQPQMTAQIGLNVEWIVRQKLLSVESPGLGVGGDGVVLLRFGESRGPSGGLH